MASLSDKVNPFKVADRVKFSDKEHFLHGEKGSVRSLQDISVHVKTDSGVEIITSFRNLRKLKNK